MFHYDSEAIYSLIGRIYDASLDARAWPQVVTDIASLQDTDKALLFTPTHLPTQGGFVFPVGISESAMQQWADCYAPHDVWTRAVKLKGLAEGDVATDEDLVPHEEFLQTRWYQEFLSRIGIARVCCGIVFGVDSANMPMTAFSTYRDITSPAFGTRERELTRILIPHLSRSLGIMNRLHIAELKSAASLAALDRLTSGVLLFGANRTVLFANRSARKTLSEEDGLRLRLTANGNTVLAAASIETQHVLDSALNTCLTPVNIEVAHFSEAVRIKRSIRHEPIVINLSALPLENEFGSGPERPLAIGFLNDPSVPVKMDEQLLRKIYDFSPAECRLANQLCLGGSLFEIGRRMNISENTVKTQIKSLFAKTGTNRQAQLVKTIHSLHSTYQ